METLDAAPASDTRPVAPDLSSVGPSAAPETSFTQDGSPAEEAPALPSDLSSGDVPNDEPAPGPDEILPSEEEDPRDWAGELDALTAERDEANERVNALELSRSELEDQNAALLEQLDDLKGRLLSETITNVSRAEGKRLSDSQWSFIDKSLLVDENGLPNAEAVRSVVSMFGREPFASAESLGIGVQTNHRPNPNAGYENPNPYTGHGGEKLDARNRKFNPFGRK